MARGVNKVIEHDLSNLPQFQVDAFWSKVDVAENIKDCWNWLGAKKTKGYGNVRINKSYLLAHRVAFQLINGSIPSGYVICHICDNPSCCNPHHLMLGTIKSNAADMLIKNRGKKPEYAARGAVNGNSKLCDKDVINIRASYKANELNQYQLADKYNVTQSAIGSIVRNETWRHV